MTEQASNEWVWDVDPDHPKDAWGEGPWQHEPDKVVWVDEDSDLDCMIVRGPSGALCGYVGVPKGHPCYGMDYDYVTCEVHGGLTFAKECHGNICHVPEPGRSDDLWWLGFDCAHSGDYCPAFTRYGSVFKQARHETYKNMKYVKRECADLASQLKVVQP